MGFGLFGGTLPVPPHSLQQASGGLGNNARPAMSPAEVQRALQQMTNLYPSPVQRDPQPAAEPIPRADMQVFDLIGWRVWRLTSSGHLMSLSASAVWLPGEPMAGEVGDHNGRGVHVFKGRAPAIAEIAQQPGPFVVGSVILWGDVVEHERGYRAERAKIVSLDDVILPNASPWSDECGKALAFLRKRYGVEPA